MTQKSNLFYEVISFILDYEWSLEQSNKTFKNTFKKNMSLDVPITIKIIMKKSRTWLDINKWSLQKFVNK